MTSVTKWSPGRRHWMATGVAAGCALCALAAPSPSRAQAPAPDLQIDRPVAKAIVRETVPVKLNPRDIPSDGYVSVSVDGNFLGARVLPTDATQSDVVYYWDTKAPYEPVDDPSTKNYLQDGSHTVTVSLYGSGGKLIGVGSVPVTIQNQIKFSDQGINLMYKWHENEDLKYHRTTDLTIPAEDNPTTIQTGSVQASAINYVRSVEDVTDNQALLRDQLDPAGYTISGGQPRLISAQYNVKSSYRTYNQYGDLLSEMAPLSSGDHFAFGVPVLPGRRVAQGDSWEVPIPVSLDWSGADPLNVTGEARLESFEWQNGYPTAKIHETFNGSAKLPTSAKGMFAGTNLEQLNIDRVIYIAYNSGRMIKMHTVMQIVGDLTSSQISALATPAAATPAAAGAGPADNYGGSGGAPGDYGGNGGAPPPGYGMPDWLRNGQPPPWITHPGTNPSQYMMGGGAAAAATPSEPAEPVSDTTPVHMTYTEDSQIVL